MTGLPRVAAIAALGGIAVGACGGPATPGDKAAIEAIVRDYILAHPEILPQAMERLQAQGTSKAIAADRKALETPFAGAWAGNAAGDVTLVMFSDYACGYCRASLPDVERLLRDDPRLRVVWREIPILGPESETAARSALAAAKAGKYQAFHHALFTGRPDARGLTGAATAAGLDAARLSREGRAADISGELQNNVALAQRLGVTGTPAFVIGTKMHGGAIGYDALKAAVAEARAAQ